MVHTYEIDFDLPARNEDDDPPTAIILFSAGGYQPRHSPTFYDPGSAEMFEDIEFVAAHSADETVPLLPHEIELCKEFIESAKGFQECNEIALNKVG